MKIRSGGAPYDKYTYDQEYIKNNLKRVLITFNRTKKADMEIADFLSTREESMTGYIKRLIHEDMERQNKNRQKAVQHPDHIATR